jgi:ABC-type histidine transport system ATPase subunit
MPTSSIPLEHFIPFAYTIYCKLDKMQNDPEYHRNIIALGKGGNKTFIHLIWFGLPAPARIKVNGSYLHAFKNSSGIIWKYNDQHVRQIIRIFKELNWLTYTNLKKVVKLPRKDLNINSNKIEDKITQFNKMWLLQKVSKIDFDYTLKLYSEKHNINYNPNGLLI